MSTGKNNVRHRQSRHWVEERTTFGTAQTKQLRIESRKEQHLGQHRQSRHSVLERTMFGTARQSTEHIDWDSKCKAGTENTSWEILSNTHLESNTGEIHGEVTLLHAIGVWTFSMGTEKTREHFVSMTCVSRKWITYRQATPERAVKSWKIGAHEFWTRFFSASSGFCLVSSPRTN